MDKCSNCGSHRVIRRQSVRKGGATQEICLDCGATKCYIKHCLLTCPNFQWAQSVGRYFCAIGAMFPTDGDGQTPLSESAAIAADARLYYEANKHRQANYKSRGLTREQRVMEISKKYASGG